MPREGEAPAEPWRAERAPCLSARREATFSGLRLTGRFALPRWPQALFRAEFMDGGGAIGVAGLEDGAREIIVIYRIGIMLRL